MSSICWPHPDLHTKKQDLRRSLYSIAAITAIWSINLIVIFFGWPFLLYGKLKYRKHVPDGRVASRTDAVFHIGAR